MTTHNDTQTYKLFSLLAFSRIINEMKLFVGVLVVGMAFSAVQQAAAVEAPAPSPTSDAFLSIPMFVATVATLAFGFIF
ncbi:Arabinogalactan protein 13 [Hirschfeldia incana]|nr:Arabinogalactan protein 13 [Hirschfeldia incana]